jgi:hypothetical protein
MWEGISTLVSQICEFQREKSIERREGWGILSEKRLTHPGKQKHLFPFRQTVLSAPVKPVEWNTSSLIYSFS